MYALERPGSYATPGTQLPASTPRPAKSGGCFEATAACDPRAPEVVFLTSFRDEVLEVSCVGRLFMAAYYAVSPPIAALIGRSRAMRLLAIATVIRPAAWVARSLSGVKIERCPQ